MNTYQSTWHHIRRSPFQSMVAIFIMVVSFFTLSSFATLSQGLSSVLNYFETTPEITIFLKDGLDKATVEGLQKELANYEGIREIKFISKQKALEIYQEQNKDNPLLTEMVTASILPASFEVSVSNPQVLDQIAQNFSAKTQAVDEIIYQKDIIQSMLRWTDIIRQSGLIIVATLAAISFFVIFTIIGMKITNRKEEIRISRLLGASKFYIKKSFLLEGLFYGLVGSLIGSAISFFLAFYLKDQVNQVFSPINFISLDLNYYSLVLLAQIIFGVFIGLSASWIGVKRYIKF